METTNDKLPYALPADDLIKQIGDERQQTECLRLSPFQLLPEF